MDEENNSIYYELIYDFGIYLYVYGFINDPICPDYKIIKNPKCTTENNPDINNMKRGDIVLYKRGWSEIFTTILNFTRFEICKITDINFDNNLDCYFISLELINCKTKFVSKFNKEKFYLRVK